MFESPQFCIIPCYISPCIVHVKVNATVESQIDRTTLQKISSWYAYALYRDFKNNEILNVSESHSDYYSHFKTMPLFIYMHAFKHIVGTLSYVCMHVCSLISCCVLFVLLFGLLVTGMTETKHLMFMPGGNLTLSWTVLRDLTSAANI